MGTWNDRTWRRNYFKVHQWLRRNLVKVNKCHQCESVTESKYEWALITGLEYEKKAENFIELCTSCHRKYDMTKEGIQRLRLIGSQIEVRTTCPIRVSKPTGEVVGEYSSITDACLELGISKTSVSNVLSGRAKRAGRLKWEKI